MSYPPKVEASPTGDYVSKREAVLHVMAAASFLVFFQAYLVAPLIPSLATEFHASPAFLGLLVPAYMLPYGISTLFYGPISDRFGRTRHADGWNIPILSDGVQRCHSDPRLCRAFCARYIGVANGNAEG